MSLIDHHTGLALRSAEPLAAVKERIKRDPESWRYTDIEKLLAKPVAHTTRMPEVPPAAMPRLRFIDGVLVSDRSHYGDLPRDFITADAKNGYSIELAGQTCLVTHPVELLFTTSPGASGEIATKLHIALGASGRLSLLERYEGSAATHLVETTIDLAPQAKLVHGKVVHGGARSREPQSEPVSGSGAHIAFTKTSVAEGAYYDNFTLVKGGRLVRNEIEAKLAGPLAQCALNGLMLLSNDDHADTAVRIAHAAPDGTSRQFYKTIASGKSRGIFQGRVTVDKGADKTDGRQLSRALLLSDRAEVDAKPELVINADDVKCSHGSSVGNLDKDALFYLRARGLGETEARALLIRAFADEALNEIHIPEWRDAFAALVEDWCHEQI